MSGSALDNVTWKGNSRKMYKAVMSAVPSIFRSTIKREIESWVVEHKVKVVTEDLLLKMFHEKAPKGYKQKLGPKLEAMKTTREETRGESEEEVIDSEE
ncbi:hypothetical protein Cpap_2639 [Ruminiclostridium papyrosolvens DSM 2782]|uniref:Uncharacterized protein n=1 Tax=Ruminiclostridium papyrosolvens DSM 2782 TaxID=588581 RepID=F1TC38_9FIRM|nr:hypothetical protein [Ruminiclostridium papyrosolvens]EGD47953.1 hypothetical protein Cpap_2639 [Ruminiclostridium papyrosolvens DSM 2782]WES35155.1 hypothetical protein P0092_04015 [Ruminiclostridium papyrosolvens DSM 2782]